MSTIQVQIPDSLQKSLDDLAARDSTAIAEKLSALMTENYLIERAKRGSRDRKSQKGKSRKVSGNLNKSSRLPATDCLTYHCTRFCARL
ncbi:MAG: hypothetical protein RLZZ148_1454 [Cyanobacteriota bacterium]